MRRKLTLIALGILLGLAALEATLQVLAYLKWQQRAHVAVREGGDVRETVLCVGDSFTFGLGATDSSNAWPAAAERAFAKSRASAALRFSNLGWPGSNSAAVLGRLPRQLAAERPRYVCVLVGYNDFWSDDQAVGSDDSFPIELRTARLFRMIAAWLGGGPPASPETVDQERPPPTSLPRESAPFRGVWSHGPAWIDFLDDGRVVSNGGELPVAWFHDPDAIWLEMRDGSPRQRIEWRAEGDRLDLDSAAFGGRLSWQRGLPLGDRLARARHALLHEDHSTAETELRTWLEEWTRDPANDPARAFDVRAEVARVMVRRGNTADAERELPPLLAMFEASPTQSLAEQLVPLVAELRRGDVATVLIVRVLRDLPTNAAALHLVMRYALAADDPLAVDTAVREVLTRDGFPTVLRLGLLGLRPVLHDRDLDVTLDCLVQAAALVENEDQRGSLLRAIAFDRARLSSAAFRAAVERSALDSPARERAQAEFDRAWSVPNRTGTALAANLRSIVALCRAAGAEPILLDYPLERPDVLAVVDDVADRLGAARVRCGEHFAQLLATSSRSDWFIADGHCNDRGYVEMGRLVAELLTGLHR